MILNFFAPDDKSRTAMSEYDWRFLALTANKQSLKLTALDYQPIYAFEEDHGPDECPQLTVMAN